MRAKNWLMDEHRSAIWVGSRDQLFSSACLMLSLNPWKYILTKREELVMSSLCMEILFCDNEMYDRLSKN